MPFASFSHFLLHAGLLAALVAVQAAVFLPLAYFFPGKASQPLFRRDIAVDLIYYFGAALVVDPANDYLIRFAGWNNGARPSPLDGWPLPLQLLAVVFLVDFLQYWMHRLLHGKTLWKIHSIHHSSVNVDWLSNVRSHPINYILFISVVMDIVRFLSINPFGSIWIILFYNINSCLVHANLNWTYGPLRHVFASPVFHRWHHTSPKEGGNKNFAPYFSCLDLAFGTFYMPKNARPMKFGAPYDTVPDDFPGQLAYPFTRKP